MSESRKNKKNWPTKEVMNQIYDQNLWGGKKGEFYSGEGSNNPLIVEPYIKSVIAFFKSFDTPISVCDLGCGDFNVGIHLVKHTKYYIACDIVESLVKRNQSVFQKENLSFEILDMIKDDLPKADCVIIRQVLQHLSNSEIQQILEKLSGYKYLILTEHVPDDKFIPNEDKIASLGIRLKKKQWRGHN